MATTHRYAITIAEMAYDAPKNRIEVSLKVAAHDFEQLLAQVLHRPVHLEEQPDSSKAEHLISTYCEKYLSTHFKLSSGGFPTRFHYLGRELTPHESLYFYFSFSGIHNPKQVTVFSDVMTSLSRDQQNRIHYTYGGVTKSATLSAAQNKATLSFD